MVWGLNWSHLAWDTFRLLTSSCKYSNEPSDLDSAVWGMQILIRPTWDTPTLKGQRDVEGGGPAERSETITESRDNLCAATSTLEFKILSN